MLGRHKESLLVAIGYVTLSCAYFGWEALPHPGRVLPIGASPEVLVWSFGWWEHALATLANPFVSHAVYAPYGVNIAWTYTAPGLAFVFSPVTALFGAVVSYNVAYVLAPGLAAWTGYLLCRYLTGSLWASLVGGYLFGFSDAVLRQTKEGALNLGWVFLFPLIALVVLRFLRGELSARGLAWRLGALIAFQVTISTEFALMATIGLAAGLLLAYAFDAPLRARLRASVVPIVSGYVLSLVFVAPFTYYLLSDFATEPVETSLKLNGSDALSVVVPNEVVAIGGNDLGSIANHAASKMSYLGVPTAIIVALYAVRAWRTRGGRFLLTALVLTLIVPIGVELQVYGHTISAAPWWTAAAHVPGLADALPYRFGLLLALVASVTVALWTASTRGLVFKRPYVLPALAAAALAPALSHPSLFELKPPSQARFFTAGLAKACIPKGETLAVFPGRYDALLWQARSGFRYDLAVDGLQPFPQYSTPLNPFDRDPVVWDFTWLGDVHPTTDRMLAFAGAHGVDRFVSIGGAWPTMTEMRAFGRPSVVGDAIVSPGCGSPSLKTRKLGRYVDEWEVDPQPYSSRPNIVYCGPSGTEEGRLGLTAPAGTTPASFVEGKGLTCDSPPPGAVRHGFAPVSAGVPPGIYPYYSS